jgi:hypothetical protein
MRLVIPAHLEDLLRSSKLLIRRQWDYGIDHGRLLKERLLGRNIDGRVVIP